jgi:hypothetical protein
MNLPTILWFINEVIPDLTFNNIFTFHVLLVTQSHTDLSVTGVKSGCQVSYATETRYIDFVWL